MFLDTVVGFEENRSPKQYLHILVDHFTRFDYVSTAKNQTSMDIIKLIDSVHKENPIDLLLIDQYRGLGSKEFEDYCTNSNINHIFIAVDSALSNGLNERLNQTLVNRIRCKRNSDKSEKSWMTVARSCVNYYNNTIHSVTGVSPQYLLMGSVIKKPHSRRVPWNFGSGKRQGKNFGKLALVSSCEQGSLW